MSKVVTGKVRFSYATVWEPKGINGSEPKYSVSILIPKNDGNTLGKIKKAIDDALVDGKSKLADKNGKVNVATLKMPLRDGDVDRPDDENYKNCYFLNANSKTAPQIVDAAVNPILDKTEFYSGCYGRASLTFYSFNSNGNKGIACGLNHLQKLTDGEPLGARGNAADDFSDDDDDLLG